MKTRNNRNGSAILTVLGIITVVSIVCGMLSFSATQQMRACQITRDMLRARLIAESGLNKAINAVRNDFDAAVAYAATDSFGGGNCTVLAQPQAEGADNRVQLVSEGVCGMGRAKVTVDLENRPLIESDDDEDNFFPLPYDVTVGSTMTLQGNFSTDVFSIHANGKISNNSSAVSLPAGSTVSSSGTITLKKGVSAGVTVTPNQPLQPVSTAALTAAIDALKAYAQSHGAVYETAADIPANPPGGIAWCKGGSAGWSETGTGCFIFDGAVGVIHPNITSTDGYPALVVTSASDIKLNAGSVIDGAMILPNSSFTFNGTATINGAILVGQVFSPSGTANLYAGDAQGFTLPPDEQVTDNLVVTTWH